MAAGPFARQGDEEATVKDEHGRQVPGVGRLVVFSVIAGLVGVLAFVWGANQGGSRDVLAIILCIVIWAALLVLWAAVAVTQWKRRNLSPRD
jgi:cation transporter-like permease